MTTPYRSEPMNPATQIRQQLNQLLESVEEREAAIAKAIEELTVDGAMRAAWSQAQQVERDRVLCLIDAQIDQLDSAGMNVIVLRTLRGVVANG
jgi:ABC-type transporter Mla MlaB component